MAKMHIYYFGQLVTEDELNEGFDWLQDADHDQFDDLALGGICIPSYDVAGAPPTPPGLTSPPSWTPRENAPPDWEMIIDTGFAHDPDGKRVAVVPPTNVLHDCEKDYLGIFNAVAVGKERWISIFLKHKILDLDPRTDDHGATVYFEQDESYEFQVHQGPEETAPATTKPPKISDGILLCDVIITNATGSAGIQNADRDFTRADFLLNLDLSVILGTGSKLYARNLAEAIYLFAEEMAGLGLGPGFAGFYLRRDGANSITGNIEPDADDTRLWGSGAGYFRTGYFSAFSERPTSNSFGSTAGPHSSLDVIPTYGHWSTPQKTINQLNGAESRRRDLMGRDHRRYHVEREDFMWPNGWTGVPGVETRWKQLLTAGGTLVHNPSTFAQLMAGGFAQSNVFAIADGVDVYADGWIYRADIEPYFVWYVLPQTLTATAMVFMGMRGATGNFFGLMYDPTNSQGYGIGNANLWFVYDDGINTALVADTSQAFTVGIAHRIAVAIEQDITGDYWLICYKDSSLVYSFNLTDGGGTYEAVALGEVFDLYYLLRETAAATSRVLLDFYEGQQLLDA